MAKQGKGGESCNTLAAIEARISEIDQEKKQLLAIREKLQKSRQEATGSNSLTLAQKIAIFRRLFRGRTDIFANRWENQQGRSGYAVACDNEWVQGICHKPRIKCQDCDHRQFTGINDQIIYNHLAGEQVVGIYPLLHDNACCFLAADFDKGNWQKEVSAMSEACVKFKVPHGVEVSRSGNGAHLWIFFTERIPAVKARQLGFFLLDHAMEVYPNLSFESYDRLFPNQDILPDGGFGNLIALPLQKKARQSGNSSFVDLEFKRIDDQWQYLEQLKALPSEDLFELIAAYSPNPTIPAKQINIENQLPWEMTAKEAPIAFDSLPKKVTITLANQVYFDLGELPNILVARLRRLARFSNPVFFKTQALRFSTHRIPRFISCARVEQGYLALPRGCLDAALLLLDENRVEVCIDDKRQYGEELNGLRTLFTLREEQQAAVSAIAAYETGILHAPTAFGKTVAAIDLILRRKTSTLVLVHSRQLLDQWKERLGAFLPDARIGSIGGGKRKPGGIIDVATYQSLINKKDNSVSDLVQNYGHVIVDECHHVSAPRFEMVLNEVRAKYVLGLTATPERQDGHQKIIFMAVGPIRHKVKKTGHNKFEQRVIVHQFYDTPAKQLLQTKERPKISDVYSWIMNNGDRTRRLIDDVIASINQSRNPLILTERRDHSETIRTMLMERGINSVVLKGAMRVGQRKEVEKKLPTAQVVVATGRYIGEGFDLPRLDTLFLAMPIAWKGSLAQYAGRIHRESDGKTEVTIHDYVDCSLPLLQRMYSKREKCYIAMGYQIDFDGANEEILLI